MAINGQRRRSTHPSSKDEEFLAKGMGKREIQANILQASSIHSPRDIPAQS